MARREDWPVVIRLLDELDINDPKLVEALGKTLSRLPNGMLRSHLVGGNETSVLSVWRKAYIHIIGSTVMGTPDIQS